MSKAGRAKRKRAKTRKARIAVQKANQRRKAAKRWRAIKTFLRGGSYVWKGVGVAALVLGILSAVLSFLPRLSVLPLVPMHEPYPLSTLFTVSNDGPVALNDVVCSCTIANVETTRPDIVVAENTVADPVLKILAPNEKTTTTCSLLPIKAEGMSPVPQQTDVVIAVSYRPSFVPWRMSKSFRFMSTYDSNGKIQWFPMANDKNKFQISD